VIVLTLALLALTLPFDYSLYTYAQLAGSALSFRFLLDYGEGPLLDQILRLAVRENLYDNDFSTSLYMISNYPPVFLLLRLPLALVFGPAFWYGAALFVLVSWNGRRWGIPVTAALLVYTRQTYALAAPL
jgi:hypothetical protein